MSPDNLFRWIAVFSLGASMAISIYYRRRANQSSGERINQAQAEGRGMLLARLIGGLGLWASALLYLINPAWMSWAQLDLPLWLRGIGAALMIAAVPGIYWTFSSLDRNVTPTVAIRAEHRLVQHGPYRYIRHPLYTFGLLAFIGLTLLSANWFIGLMTILAAAYLMRRTPLEELRLLEHFGEDYQAYMQQTGRYLPRVG